jgi:hypothetical protein
MQKVRPGAKLYPILCQKCGGTGRKPMPVPLVSKIGKARNTPWRLINRAFHPEIRLGLLSELVVVRAGAAPLKWEWPSDGVWRGASLTRRGLRWLAAAWLILATSHATALKRSNRIASRSRSGRSLVRPGRWMLSPFSRLRASSIGPSFRPRSRSDTCSR